MSEELKTRREATRHNTLRCSLTNKLYVEKSKFIVFLVLNPTVYNKNMEMFKKTKFFTYIKQIYILLTNSDKTVRRSTITRTHVCLYFGLKLSFETLQIIYV